MEISSGTSAEIIIVGAGLAGVTAAAVLGQQSRRVILVDPRPSCPPVFKAEKIDQEQVRLLRRFGLLRHLLPYAGEVRKVRVAYDGRLVRTIPIEQYGITYQDMVNALRSHLPATVEFCQGRAESATVSADIQRVRLAGGNELTSRLIILACGVSIGLQAKLGLKRLVLQNDQSLVLGFSIAASAAHDFDFDSVTYYSIDPTTCIDYLTLFRFRETMRANLFVFRSAKDPWVRAFIREPERMLRKCFPKLDRVTGKFRVTSKVESGRADLYRTEGNPRPGLILIGDAYQSVCPSTGMGLDKILTDVDALAECVPRWIATPGMGPDKLADFYHHPRKHGIDAQALQNANQHRQAVMDRSLRWRLYRFLLHLKWQTFSSLRNLRPARR
jgi:2-polyprenyl-6-methoxyphenol hydroxylase-like FAD-dependent oxidoreductase